MASKAAAVADDELEHHVAKMDRQELTKMLNYLRYRSGPANISSEEKTSATEALHTYHKLPLDQNAAFCSALPRAARTCPGPSSS